MNTKAYLIVVICIAWGTVFFNSSARSQTLDPIVDYRYAGEVIRDADGKTSRSTKVINAFKKHWACPSTGLHKGPCPGWAIDHVIPLACGGRDAVFNMAWIPDEGKSCAADYCKDRYERKVYGGNDMGPGCP
jgi:hypothetical protein